VLANRISDDLINDLSRVPALRVISRATSRLYSGQPVDVAVVGAELGVRYVVEGSVRLQGGSLRINVALIDPRTRLQVWSERFERDRAADAPALQDEIARGIARHLHVSILTGEDRRRAPAAADVASLLAKGWGGMLRISSEGTASGADKYFEQVLARDPENVSALIGLGAYHASVVAMFLVAETEPHLAIAQDRLEHAIRLNARASLAHYFWGILCKTRGDPHAALTAFRTVLEINPSFAPAYAQVGHVLSRIGRLNEAMEHVRYAIRLSPKDPNLGLWSLFGGQILLEQRDDEAMDWLTRAVQLDPRNPFIHATLAAALALEGDSARAARHAGELKALSPWVSTERMKERLLGLSDKGAEPRRLLQGLELAFPGQS
jgi:TolB-like protein/Flp pilus assembly protein TadD